MLFVYCVDLKFKTKKVILPKEVVNHINQYKNNEFKKISAKAWSVLFDLFKSEFKLDVKKEKVCFSKNHKPYLKSNKIYFSISHSLNLIALAISDKPVGVDIEKLIPIKIANLISKRILNNNELKKYSLSKNKSEYITKMWTKKESMVKLTDSSILNIDSLVSINTKGIETIEIFDSKGNKYYLSFTNN